LAAGEVREYLMFRMRAAGYRGPDLFSDDVVKLIARGSGGLTRRINLIADKALLAAFAENTYSVKRKYVEAAVRDSEFSRYEQSAQTPRHVWVAVALLAGAAIGAGSYALFDQHRTPAAPAAVVAPPPAKPAPPAVAVTPVKAEPPP